MKALGLDERHEWPVFFAKVKDLMNDPVTKDARGLRIGISRLIQTLPMTVNSAFVKTWEWPQRLSGMTPYGFRIHQIAQRVLCRAGCIDLEVWGDKLFIRLNLQPETIQFPIRNGEMIRIPVPINETRCLPKTPADQL